MDKIIEPKLKPLVSVLMSVYREPKEWLNESISSIVNQTYPNLEIIIVLDNPENTALKDVVEKYRNIRQIHLIENSCNQGLVASLNKGLTLCKGEYVARMDADDIAGLDRIEKQLKYLKQNNLDLVGGEIVLYSETGAEKREAVHLDRYCKKMMRYVNPIAHPTWLCKTDMYHKLGGYRDIEASEDFDFLIRAVLGGCKIGNVPEGVLKYRINSASISNAKESRQFVISNALCKCYKRGTSIDYQFYNEYINSKNFYRDVELAEAFRIQRGRLHRNKSLLALLYLITNQITYVHAVRKINIALVLFMERVFRKKQLNKNYRELG